MLDLSVFLLTVLAPAAALYRLWRAVRGHAGSLGIAAMRGGACLVLALVPAALVSRSFSSLGDVQLFGEIVGRVDVAEPVVALTFDDGPTPEATDRILSILEAQGVRATFFLTGQAIGEHPAAARRIVGAGHELGNHSHTHPRMVGLSLERIAEEIERTDEAIRGAGHGGPIHFRSPYGKKYVALPYYLARSGRTNILWDVEPETDPRIGADAGLIVRHVAETVRPGSIVLLHVMHDGRAPSMEAVPGIIEALRQRGYRFLTVSELLARRAE